MDGAQLRRYHVYCVLTLLHVTNIKEYKMVWIRKKLISITIEYQDQCKCAGSDLIFYELQKITA